MPNRFIPLALAALLIPAGWTRADGLGDARKAFDQGRYKEAAALLAPLAKASPASADILSLYARALHRSFRIEAALAVWNQILKADPGNEEAAAAAKKAAKLIEEGKVRIAQLQALAEQGGDVSGDCRALLVSYYPESLQGTL